ncbi:synaptonemal complex protein 2-like [Grammomys surdaster]|uniref:synaptonemal complex protein 2-like n=1 Tax=Grammomys surdaster TaxID=491861 RepID=UPI0010A09B51|nr:synaptonemal complex protein 2-like [Grammomys surdaster]
MSTLQSLINDAFHGKGFHMIEEYLQQKKSQVPQKYNHLLLHHLDRLIKGELERNDFQNCSLLLRCIQRFFRDDPDQEEPLLIQQGLIPKMVSWFETMTGFLITKVWASEALLTKALEDFLDTVLIISRHSRKGTIQMLDSFILCLGFLVADVSVKPSIQQEALRTLNCILNAAPRQERRKLSSAEGVCCLMKELARTILTVGDYSQQVALSEALCRVSVGTQRNELAVQWFDDAALAEAFKEIKNQEFETDCRQFLNFLNNRLGDQRRVYSFPCLAAFADDQEMRKPADEKLEEFWIDFNLGSQSVTFYIDNAESALWEPVQLLKEAMDKFFVIGKIRITMFIVYLKQPIVVNKREAKKIEIHFDRQLGISQASVRALEEDKQNFFFFNALSFQTSVLIKETSVLEKEDGEISSSGERETEDAEESTILPEFVDAEVDQCLITRCFNVQSVPAVSKGSCEQTKSEDQSPENSKPEEPEQVTSEYEFPVDVQEPSIQNQASKLNNTKEDPASLRDGEQDRRLLFNDRKHYFLESNEDSNSSTSERSLTQNHKRKSLRTYSQRRKPGVRSLRILPLSPVRSGRAPEKDEAGLTPLWKSISRRNDSTLLKISETKLRDNSVLLTPEASTEKIGPRSPPPSSSSSSLEHPEVEEENVPEIVNQEPFMGSSSFKHKLENLEHRDETPDGSAVTLKQSRLEDAPGFPAVTDISTPSEEDVSENANGSAFKMAFENFTRDLKRKFELKLKQKGIPLSSEKAKEVPACLIRLWNQIHMCRLDKLDRFHSSVLQELSSLEKDLQTLKCLEKDALASSLSLLSLGPKNQPFLVKRSMECLVRTSVSFQEFWERQSADLQSFCDRQVWRYNSLRGKMEKESGVPWPKSCPSELCPAANSP